MEQTMEHPKANIRRNIFLTIIIAIFLLAAAVQVYQWQLKELVVIIDGRETAVTTFSNTLEELMLEQNINLGTYDEINFNPSTLLKDGMEVTIAHAIEVSLKVGSNEPFRVFNIPDTAKNILEEAGVEVEEMDRVEPALDDFIEESSMINVTKVEKEIIEETKEIPFQIERKTDSNLERGLRSVLSKGKNGKEKVSWEVTYENGKEVSREKVGHEIMEEPQNRVIVEGSLQLASRGDDNFRFKKMILAEATAYTHTGNLTHTDTVPKLGTVAVDPENIPLGTNLYIEGYGFGKAEDIGTAIKGSKVDVFLNTRQEALAWGRKKVKVYILE